MVMRKGSVEWTQAMVREGSTCFEENTQALRTALDDVIVGVLEYYRSGVTRFNQLSGGYMQSEQRTASEFETLFGLSSSDRLAVPAPSKITKSSAHLTGLGARFDGYLSALLTVIWEWLVQK